VAGTLLAHELKFYCHEQTWRARWKQSLQQVQRAVCNSSNTLQDVKSREVKSRGRANPRSTEGFTLAYSHTVRGAAGTYAHLCNEKWSLVLVTHVRTIYRGPCNVAHTTHRWKQPHTTQSQHRSYGQTQFRLSCELPRTLRSGAPPFVKCPESG
jgi:hypothetical protein